MLLIEIIKSILANRDSALFYTPPIYGGATSYIFKKPAHKTSTNDFEKIEDHLTAIDKLRYQYDICYGYITYESGYQFEEKLHDLRESRNENLLSFSFFNNEGYEKTDSAQIDNSGIAEYLDNHKFNCSNLVFNTSRNDYITNIKRIKKYIEEGYTYQVNYTLKSFFNFSGDGAAFILNLIFNQSAKYIAIINDGGKIIISSSPELFFKVENGEIMCRPMKGTIKRGINIHEDLRLYTELSDSDKDKAENIMIVDLLRNDIGRIADIDSVKVSRKYNIEKYESVFQMISEIKGRLANPNFHEIITNIFPCGSITGAPKISTMKIIKEIEKSDRNIYTGAIGILEREKFIFNVPIRTIEIDTQNNVGQLGLGSGVVWESNPENEYDEVKLKGEFLTNPVRYFELFESMLLENGSVFLLNYHLERLRESAEFFLFDHDEKKFLNYLEAILKNCEAEKKYKFKISLDKWGSYNHSVSEITEAASDVDICVSEKRILSSDKFIYFKTTNREFYDSEFASNRVRGFDETIFINEHDNITEGSRTNIFIGQNDKLYTPPVEDGLLNGCYRRHILEHHLAEVKKLKIDDLLSAERVMIANSVRKEISVKRIFRNGALIKEY